MEIENAALEDFDPSVRNLISDALEKTIERLKALRLLDGNSEEARASLSRSIMEAAARGERNEENLILYAIGRFQSGRAHNE